MLYLFSVRFPSLDRAREGNFIVDPYSGKTIRAGSANFNRAVLDGRASKIWFQAKTDNGLDDCVASFDIDKAMDAGGFVIDPKTGTQVGWNVSHEVASRHGITNTALQQMLNTGLKCLLVRLAADELPSVKNEILSKSG